MQWPHSQNPKASAQCLSNKKIKNNLLNKICSLCPVIKYVLDDTATCTYTSTCTTYSEMQSKTFIKCNHFSCLTYCIVSAIIIETCNSSSFRYLFILNGALAIFIFILIYAGWLLPLFSVWQMQQKYYRMRIIYRTESTYFIVQRVLFLHLYLCLQLRFKYLSILFISFKLFFLYFWKLTAIVLFEWTGTWLKALWWDDTA